MSDVTYVCEVCRRETKIPEGEPIPLCCRKEMGPLPYCTTVPNPEMTRNYEDGEPCADGTVPESEK